MQVDIAVGGHRYRAALERGACLAIPLAFDGPQPSHFGAPAASAQPMQAGSFVGDTRQGGSCNVYELRINPHCNGTHTESVGHVVHGAAPVHEVLQRSHFAATLVSVAPCPAAETREHYRPALQPGDLVITRAMLAAALSSARAEFGEALVVRTLPNDPAKRARRYGSEGEPPFLTLDAAALLVERGVQHLLVDFPSVDRMYDEGKLSVHRCFWQLPQEGHALGPGAKTLRTITEMIFVPDEVPDGHYLLALQVPAFLLDAAPSRPWLYPLEALAAG